MTYAIKLLVSIALITVLSTGCKEEETGTANVILETDITFNGQPLDTSTVYLMGDNSFRFDVVKMYLGGFYMQSGDTYIDRTDLYVLVEEEEKNTPLLEVDIQTGISEFGFWIGVDEARNNQSEQEFLSRPVQDPLSIKDPAMHWNWMTGYRFVRVDGEIYRPINAVIIDTTIQSNIVLIDTMLLVNGMTIDTAIIDTSFMEIYRVDTILVGMDTSRLEYHLGTDELLTPYIAVEGLDRLKAGDNTLLVRFDVASLLRGVNFGDSTQHQTHTFDNMDLAKQLVENYTKGAIGYRLN